MMRSFLAQRLLEDKLGGLLLPVAKLFLRKVKKEAAEAAAAVVAPVFPSSSGSPTLGPSPRKDLSEPDKMHAAFLLD